jgi:hypothetical protein
MLVCREDTGAQAPIQKFQMKLRFQTGSSRGSAQSRSAREESGRIGIAGLSLRDRRYRPLAFRPTW